MTTHRINSCISYYNTSAEKQNTSVYSRLKDTITELSLLLFCGVCFIVFISLILFLSLTLTLITGNQTIPSAAFQKPLSGNLQIK